MHACLADVVSDLVQNGVEAGARRVGVLLDRGPVETVIRVADDGRGMDGATLEKAADPFWSDPAKHPGRRVGLGIPFLLQTAQQTGGRAVLRSRPGRGTVAEAVFPTAHPDLPPLGDLVLLWTQCLSLGGGCDVRITRIRRDGGGRPAKYRVRRADVIRALGTLEDAGALGLLGEYLGSLEDDLDKG